MTVAVQQVDRTALIGLLQELPAPARRTFEESLLFTTQLWIGTLEGKIVCTWGIIPPSLMSDRAYLWLYTTEEIKGHEFLFIRHSQCVIEELLKLYPTITGVTLAGKDKTIRWLKWLGAKFEEPNGAFIPFTIRKKVNG